ncbi:hypothetical protein GF373_16950, partial [bacterium]|nr:hypothetical protein [bacterium]
ENPPSFEPTATTPKPAAANKTAPNAAADAFSAFMKAANAPGLIDAKTKKLMAIMLSISQHCEPCLRIHLQNALAQGMRIEEIDEAAWLAIAFCGAPAKMFYEGMKKEIV